MKLKLCIAVMALMAFLIPTQLGAAPSSANGPDFAKMMQVIDELKQKTGADFDVA